MCVCERAGRARRDLLACNQMSSCLSLWWLAFAFFLSADRACKSGNSLGPVDATMNTRVYRLRPSWNVVGPCICLMTTTRHRVYSGAHCQLFRPAIFSSLNVDKRERNNLASWSSHGRLNGTVNKEPANRQTGHRPAPSHHQTRTKEASNLTLQTLAAAVCCNWLEFDNPIVSFWSAGPAGQKQLATTNYYDDQLKAKAFCFGPIHTLPFKTFRAQVIGTEPAKMSSKVRLTNLLAKPIVLRAHKAIWEWPL